MNMKLKNATEETSEGNKVPAIQAAIAVLKREMIEMDQKREIVSWELRNMIAKQKGKGKDDYLEISYLDELK
jgi:hypothetical protein